LIVVLPSSVVNGSTRLIALTLGGVAMVCVCACAAFMDAAAAISTATDCSRCDFK
jgi:hypothetical protein